jgi:hypothetical protein
LKSITLAFDRPVSGDCAFDNMMVLFDFRFDEGAVAKIRLFQWRSFEHLAFLGLPLFHQRSIERHAFLGLPLFSSKVV